MTSRKLMHTIALGVGMALASAGFSAAYAGDYGCDPEPSAKGNNGWGQEKRGGSDGTNAGSDDGATADSKTASTER